MNSSNINGSNMNNSSNTNSSNTNSSKENGRQPYQWERRDWIILSGLALVALAAFAAGLGSFGILDPSDGYYSEGAREMVVSGNWLIPQLNYAWFFDKPILNYWLIACSYAVFGVCEFAARIPAAICGATLVPVLYAFARQFCCRRAAILSALVLLSSPMWLIMGHMSLTDMPLTFFTWVALFSFFVALERNRQNLVWIAYLSMAGGLLTKGPVAVFLVAMNLGLYVLLRRPALAYLWALVKRLHLIPGLLLTVALAAPWYLLVNNETHGAFFQEFFVNQNVNRAMGTVDHKAGPLYYIPVALGEAFPWTLILLTSVKCWFRPWLHFLKKTEISQRTRLTAFGVTTAGAILIFFSLLPTKLVTYVLPMLPALALMAGITIDKKMRSPFGNRAATVIVAALVCLIGAAGAGAIAISLLSPETIHIGGKLGLMVDHYMQTGDVSVKQVLMASLLCLSAAGLSLSMFTLGNNGRRGWRCFMTLVVLAMVAAVPSAIVFSFQEKCRDMQELVSYARKKQIDPVMLGRRTPSATFYIGRAVKFLPGTEELISHLKSESLAGKPVFFLVHRTVFDGLNREGQLSSIVRESGDWVLASKN